MASRKRSRKIFLILFLLFAILASGIILAAMLLDESPITSKIPSSMDFMPMMTAVRTINYNINTALTMPPGCEHTLELTEQEFNALTDAVNNPFAASLLRIRIPDELKNGKLKLEKGVFTIFYPYKNTKNTPFGRFINIRCDFNLEIKNGIPEIRIVSCKAGSISVPVALIQKIVEKKMNEQYSGKPADKIIREGVISLKMANEKAVLRYRPYEIIETADRIYNPDGSRKIRRTLRKIAR